MFYDRPLTCLFLVATIMGDLALLGIDFDTGGSWIRGLAVGLILGQVALLARWAAIGETLRLGRGVGVVAMVSLLVYLAGRMEPGSIAIWAAILTGYTLLLVCVTLLVHLFRFYWKRFSEPDTTKSLWQISIMELFGWTIVVAIVSYGIRFMEFGFLHVHADMPRAMAALVTVPVAITLVMKHDLRDLNRITALLIVVVFIGTGFFAAQIKEAIFWAIVAQTTYLLVWFLVRGLDSAAQEAKAIRAATD